MPVSNALRYVLQVTEKKEIVTFQSAMERLGGRGMNRLIIKLLDQWLKEVS